MLINRFGVAKPLVLNVNGVEEEYTVPSGESYVMGDIVLNSAGYVKGVVLIGGDAGDIITLIVPDSSSSSSGGASGSGSWHTVWTGTKSVGNTTFAGSAFNSSVNFSRPTKVWGYCYGAANGYAELTGKVELTPGNGTDSKSGYYITNSSASGGTVQVTYVAGMSVDITTGNLLRVSSGGSVTSQFTSTEGVKGDPNTNSMPCSVYLTRIDQYY